jgi:hypothetical protein
MVHLLRRYLIRLQHLLLNMIDHHHLRLQQLRQMMMLIQTPPELCCYLHLLRHPHRQSL